MARISLYIITALLFFGPQQTCHAEEDQAEKFVDLVTDWVSRGKDLAGDLTSGNFVKAAFDIVYDVRAIINLYKKPEKKVDPNDKKFEAINTKLESIGKSIKEMQKNILAAILDAHPKKSELRSALAVLSGKVNYINRKFKDFIHHLAFSSSSNNETLESFTEAVTGQGSDGLISRLEDLHDTFYVTNAVSQDPILNLITEDLQAVPLMCQRKQSHQQIVRALYSVVLLTDVEGFITLQGSYDLRTRLGAGAFTEEKRYAETELIQRTQNMVDHIKPSVQYLSRDLWNCESKFVKDKTYTEMEILFKKHVINEAYFFENEDCSGGSEEVCTLKSTTVSVDYSKFSQLDKAITYARRCDGGVYGCKMLKDNTDVCFNPDSRDRNMEPIGNTSKVCEPKSTGYRTDQLTLNSFKSPDLYSIFNSKPKRFTCHYCECVCDFVNDRYSDRYISLRPVEASIKENYVMTGVKLVKKNHILQLQIKAGKLLPGGVINSTDNNWVPVTHTQIDSSKREDNLVLDSNEDYHELRWDTPQSASIKYNLHDDATFTAISLDDVSLHNLNEKQKQKLRQLYCTEDRDCTDFNPAKHFIATGVRFSRKFVEYSGVRIFLAVRMTLFDYTTAQMDEEKSTYVFAETKPPRDNNRDDSVQPDGRRAIDVTGLEVPKDMMFTPEPSYEDHKFIKFTISSMDTDAGQTTLPFIDIQPVETEPPMLLSGVGLFHKSSNVEKSGGFLAPKVTTFDYAIFMQ